MLADKIYAEHINESYCADIQEMYEETKFYCTFNDGKYSGSGYEEETDEEKIRYCEEECVGLDYCGGSKEDGSDCPQAPSKEAVAKIWKEANTCDEDFRYCAGKDCKFTYCINRLDI